MRDPIGVDVYVSWEINGVSSWEAKPTAHNPCVDYNICVHENGWNKHPCFTKINGTLIRKQ